MPLTILAKPMMTCLSDGVHPNDAGQEIYFETVKSVIYDNVDVSTGKMSDVDVINVDVYKFNNFMKYDAN